MQTTTQSNQRMIWGFLVGGLVLGFFIGLGMGWGPLAVTWINSLPQDLSEQAKIDYVQTIAEAYAATSDLDTARLRLATLAGPDEDPGSLVMAALAKLGTESSTKRSSLLYLSAGIPPRSLAGGSAPVLVPVVATSAPTAIPQNAAGGSASQESSAVGSFLTDNWVLLLTALILLVGGSYILYLLAISKAEKRDAFGRAHNPARAPADAVGPIFPGSGRSRGPLPGTDPAPAPAPAAVPASVAAAPANHDADYIFHRDYKGSSRPAAPEIQSDPFRPSGPVADFDAEPPLPSPLPSEDVDDDEVADADWRDQLPPVQADQRRREEPERSGSVMGGLAGLTGLGGRLSNAFGGEGSASGSAKVQKPAPTPSVRFSPDQEGYFVAEFFAGNDFEIAKSINRGERGYVGEGGMAVSKLSTGSSAESATALEVWLFEKSQISTRTQHLLSPHLFQSGEWDRAKLESDDPRPLEARKGLIFRLEGEEAALNCRITDVEFMESGPPQSAFRRLRLEMVSEVK